MQILVDIPEHQYNNIMSFDSVNLGRVPYKGIIMYAINAIKHGRALEQEPFINKPCVSSGVCEHDKNKALDKIRAEIEQKLGTHGNISLYNRAIYDVLMIINKYKAEQGEILNE